MGLIITLILLGVLLVIIEIVLIPGIFVTGILGLISLVASCFYAFKLYGNTGGIITIIVNIVIMIVALSLALRARTWKKLSLKTEIDSKTDTNPEDKGLKCGDTGETITRLGPTGKAMFGETIVEATARNGIIDPHKEVEITHIEDNKIYVKQK